MKKKGFTLAEVMITLAIIGVVATLTLPALMSNTQEQQAITAFKKGINTLTEAAQLNAAITGFDYASFNSTDTISDEQQSLYALLSTRTSIDLKLSGTNTAAANSVKNGGAASNFVVFFRDGAALSFEPSSTPVSTGRVGEKQADGLVYGIAALYDTNGAKGPNLLSNCNANAGLTGHAAYNDTEHDCTVKANRVIKDQFGIRLRGNYAVPNGSAARWAFNN